MIEAKPGLRYRSAVCTTEVVIVRGPGTALDLSCGGAPLVPHDSTDGPTGEPAPGLDGGTSIGKRYVDAGDAVELLCTKGGTGTLTLGGDPLTLKSAKPLPSSD